jgi:hypothetical protein
VKDGPWLKAVLPAEDVPTISSKKVDVILPPLQSPTEYPPSQTRDYLKCPRFWGLRQASGGKRGFNVAMEAGSAIHEGLAYFWRGRSTVVDLKGWQEESIQAALNYLIGVWEDNPDNDLETVLGLITKGLKKGLSTDLLEGGTLIGVEMCLDHPHLHTPVPGKCSIADFVHRRSDGGVVITDHKTKLSLNPMYVAKELNQIEYDWQTRHYAYRFWRMFGEIPVERRKHLIVCAPTPKAQVSTAVFNPQKLAEFQLSAHFWWQQMAVSTPLGAINHPNFDSCQDYGGCQFQNPCHVTGLEDFFSNLETKSPLSPLSV